MRHARPTAVLSSVVLGLLATAGATGASAAPTAPAATPPYGTASDDTVAPCAAGLSGSPCTDPFFTPPANLAALADGTVIGKRTASVTPSGIVARAAYTITYRSEDTFGAPVLGSATVLLPTAAYAGVGTTPLVAFQFAEDSLGRQCAPSYALPNPGTNGITSAESPDVQSLLSTGYDVVVPDAQGAAEQFIAGRQEGHAVLDALRAAKTMTETGLTPTSRVAMMGYSGGASSTGWAAELAGSYAPDLNVVGTIEGGTPADLTEVAKYNDGAATSGLVLFAAIGLGRAYPATNLYGNLNATGKAAYNGAVSQCVNGIAGYAGKRLDDYTTTPDLIDSPTFQSALADDKLGQRAPGFPIFNYHVLIDEIVSYPQDKRLVDYYCAQNVAVTHLELQAGDHASGEAAGVPPALAWLAGRFNGAPVTNTCAITNAEPVPPLLPTVAAPAGGPTATLPEAPVAVLLPLVALAAGLTVRRLRRA